MNREQRGTPPDRASDSLTAALERQILDGRLPEGSPLPPEREIVEQFGVSRTVVREALRSLSNRGLIDSRPRHRPVVRRAGYEAVLDAVGSVVNRLLADKAGIRNLFDLRIMMEAALVRTAATHATREHIARLKAALDRNGAAMADADAFFSTDIAFHRVFYEIPDNPILPALHQAYTDWLETKWRQMPDDADRNRLNFEAHTRVFDAILLRDADAAEDAMRTHLLGAWRQVSGTFDVVGGGTDT